MIALKTSILFALALLLTTALRRQSAALRHLILTVAMAAALVLPVLSIGLPALRIPAPIPAFAFATTVTANSPLGTIRNAATAPISFPWQQALLLLWIAGGAIGIFRILAALLSLAHARRQSPQLETIGNVAIHQAPQGAMPIAFGLFHPTIFLPADASAWAADRRRAVLDHELAHIRRRDPVTHLLARIALSFHWWNPIAWLAWKQFLREQERSADDLVLAGGTSATDYASHLVDIARTMNTMPALAAVPMARASQLESRVSAILDSSVNRRAPGRITQIFAALISVAVLLPFAAASPAQDLIDLGIRALPNNPDQAFDYFNRAGQDDSAIAPTADLWMAVTRDRQQRLSEAESYYREAIAASPDSALPLRLFARFLRAQNRTDEAAALEARTKTVQVQATRPQLPEGVYRVGNGVLPPRVLEKVDPEYTEEARLAKLSGTVTLLTEIDPDGRAHNTTVTSPIGMGLDEKAVEAIDQWHFQPGAKDGQPVPVMATIEVNFRLN